MRNVGVSKQADSFVGSPKLKTKTNDFLTKLFTNFAKIIIFATSNKELSYGVRVAQQILDLLVLVRIQVGQQQKRQ